MALETTKRINVTFPISLLEEIRRHVPSRQRNKFIPTGHDVVEATQKELAQRQLELALHESAGAWSDEDYPELQSVSDINHYVRQLREVAMPRSWDEYAEEAENDG